MLQRSTFPTPQARPSQGPEGNSKTLSEDLDSFTFPAFKEEHR